MYCETMVPNIRVEMCAAIPTRLYHISPQCWDIAGLVDHVGTFAQLPLLAKPENAVCFLLMNCP
jgi:hypothetical protein